MTRRQQIEKLRRLHGELERCEQQGRAAAESSAVKLGISDERDRLAAVNAFLVGWLGGTIRRAAADLLELECEMWRALERPANRSPTGHRRAR